MNMNMKLLDDDMLPKGFNYPEPFLRILNLNLVNFDLWFIMNKEQMIITFEGLKKRYPDRVLIPFAKTGANDDIACFELNKEGGVQIIHDFASSGYEQRKYYETFWDWFRYAIEEMIEFE